MNLTMPFVILIVGFNSVAMAGPTTLPADALAHKQFRSVELREAGLGPHGAVLGHWWLSFGKVTGKTGVYAWQWSDVRSVGMYRLLPDGTILGGGNGEALYDAVNDRIFWDGMWYLSDHPSATSPSPKP